MVTEVTTPTLIAIEGITNTTTIELTATLCAKPNQHENNPFHGDPRSRTFGFAWHLRRRRIRTISLRPVACGARGKGATNAASIVRAHIVTLALALAPKIAARVASPSSTRGGTSGQEDPANDHDPHEADDGRDEP
jgi:hypothetical protein